MRRCFLLHARFTVLPTNAISGVSYRQAVAIHQSCSINYRKYYRYTTIGLWGCQFSACLGTEGVPIQRTGGCQFSVDNFQKQ